MAKVETAALMTLALMEPAEAAEAAATVVVVAGHGLLEELAAEAEEATWTAETS